MKRAAIVALVLAGAATARADTLRIVGRIFAASQDGEIRQKIAQTREQIEAYISVANAFIANNAPTEMRLDAFAEASGGLDVEAGAGQGTAGLVFAIRSDRCDLVQVGVSVRGELRSNDPRSTGGAQQWGEICLSGGLDINGLMQLGVEGLAMFPLVLREDGILDGRPRLTGPRSEIDETYSRVGFGFDVEGVRYQWGKFRGIAGLGFSADQHWRWRGWPGNDPVRDELSGDFWFFRLYRTRGERALADRFVDILVIGFHGIQADNGAAIVTAWPVRFYGIGLNSDDSVLVDADLGIGGTGTISSSTNGPGVHDMTTIDTTGLPQVDAAVAHVAIHGGEPHQFASVAYDRTIDTNVLADVIREDRFTLSGQLTDPAWLLRGAAFVSRARYYLDESGIADERVAGGSLTCAYTLPFQLSAGVTLEAVFGLAERAPTLDGHALPRGVRAFATLSTTRTLWKM